MDNSTKSNLVVTPFINALNALFEATTKAENLPELLGSAHQLIQPLITVKNFYFVEYFSETNSISFPYNQDELDEEIEPTRLFPISHEFQSPTAWMLINKKPLYFSSENTMFINSPSELWASRSKVKQWFGVPIINSFGICVGGFVIQSYSDDCPISTEVQDIFRHVTQYLSSNICQLISQNSLHRASCQTDSLAQELADKERAEKLQHALFKIASMSNENLPQETFFQKIHSIIDQLIYAKNFVIALYNEDEQQISLPYFIDEKDQQTLQGKTLPLGDGLSSFVIKSRKSQLLSLENIDQLISEKKIKKVVGSCEFTSWMAAPMIASNVLHGIIIIQSYNAKIIYTEDDLKLLSFVADHVAKSIEIAINVQQRQESQLKLATQHRLLEQKNADLNQILTKLQHTQKELIQKEKMASLGGLVAGIAHEINTPLGICVTGISHLEEEYKIVSEALNKGNLTEAQLIDFFDEIAEILKILTTNTHRGASLINSFKQVAVDQSSNDLRTINLCQYLNEIILSLRPNIKRSKAVITIECDEALSIEVNAGAIAQIISNLVMNSLRHGFKESEEGRVLIEAYEKNNNIIIKYRDDGEGIDAEALKQLFEPFYTTKRGEGGSGLGTHLIYNLVTGALNGKITAQSQLGKGLAYLIKFPIK